MSGKYTIHIMKMSRKVECKCQGSRGCVTWIRNAFHDLHAKYCFIKHPHTYASYTTTHIQVVYNSPLGLGSGFLRSDLARCTTSDACSASTAWHHSDPR